MVLPLIGWGALAAGGLAYGGARAVKEELGLDATAAAREELNQIGTGKGFDPKKGTIHRSLFERLRDASMGNNYADILAATKSGHLKNLKGDRTTLLLQDARPDFAVEDNMTQSEIDKIYRKTQRVDPIITQIKATGELGDKYTTEELRSMDVEALTGVLKQAKVKERDTEYETNPVIQQQLADARQDRITADKRFNATQQLAISQMGIAQQQQANQMQIAQMNNQLQMRRQDSADRRSDRRDRQAMIQQMMAGLSTLGASIAI